MAYSLTFFEKCSPEYSNANVENNIQEIYEIVNLKTLEER